MNQNLQTLSVESSDMNNPFKLTDEKLIARFQDGDINAYNELVHRYKDRLLNFVFRYFNNREQAEDVVQDTMIKLYTHASYYKNIAKFYEICLPDFWLPFTRLLKTKIHGQ